MSATFPNTVVSDMEKPFGESQMAYHPLCEELALDFGLSAMFATPDGDLLGRSWFDQLKKHDGRIAGLARARKSRASAPTTRSATGPGWPPSEASSRPRSAGC